MTQADDLKPYTAATAPPAPADDRLPLAEDGGASAAESRRQKLSRGVIGGALLVLAAAGLWGAYAEVEETVDARGTVIPASNVRAVQHLEGGVVTEIAVREGQLAEQGVVLLRLDPAQIKARHEQALIEETALRLKAERLRAIGDGREPNFGFADPKFKELVQDQWAVYNGYLRAIENRRAIIESRIDQRRADLKRLQDEDETLTRRAQILAEELAMREELFQKGWSPKILLLNVKRQVADVRGELGALIARREKLTKIVEEAEGELRDVETQAKAEALSEMGLVTARLAQAAEETRRLQARLDAFEVKAPVRGFVKGIAHLSKNQVVPAGGTMLEIVPIDDELIAEVRLAPRDIGRVSVGQPVAVQVSGAGSGAAGRVGGELKEVSASTFKDDAGIPYFRAWIALDQDFVGADPKANRILPGMQVDVRVRTGRRSLFEYLFLPAAAPRRLL